MQKGKRLRRREPALVRAEGSASPATPGRSWCTAPRLLFCAALTLLLTSCGGNGGSSGGPPDTAGGPAFVITSPKDGASIAAPTFFAVQPFDPNQVASIQLEADGQPLEADTAGETSTRVFVLPEDFPAGALTLSARVSGNDGRTQSRSVTVQVESEPLTSTTVGPDGGVVGDREENGALSTMTIPPGVAQGARVSIETRTQEEVTDETGVDYDALGVTFLGAQRVRSDTPIPATLQLSSGGFGNRVQPGQAVVNFLIRPDANGDGTDELTVINDASVAPNDAIVSDPPRNVLIGTGARIVSGLGIERLNTAQATPAAEPGMVVELEASGLPVASRFDVVTVVKSEVAPVADATLTLVAPDPDTPELQRASFVMPILPPAPPRRTWSTPTAAR